MTLPPLLVLTDRRAAADRGRDLLDTVSAAVAGGARAVLLREKDLPPYERAALARSLRRVLAPYGGWLLVASNGGLGGDGLHLAEADQLPARFDGAIVGWSCHNADGLARAASDGCDYATVSPVFPSESKPGYGPILGASGLAALVRSARLPVYALGGVDAATAGACRAAGASGIAVLGAVMGAEDPELSCRMLLAAWHSPAGVPA